MYNILQHFYDILQVMASKWCDSNQTSSLKYHELITMIGHEHFFNIVGEEAWQAFLTSKEEADNSGTMPKLNMNLVEEVSIAHPPGNPSTW